jgi:hypothetical protein
MKAIEINSKTDKKGHLKINYPLRQADKNVRVLILVEEDTEADEERIWLEAVSKTPAFNFLYEKEEDIYSVNDGEPLYD